MSYNPNGGATRRMALFDAWTLIGLLACLLVLANLPQLAAMSGIECGHNPMHPVQLVSQKTGKPLNHVLTVLKDIDRSAFDALAGKFRQYAACVGVVDTGYFRRRRTAATASRDTDVTATDDEWRLLTKILEQDW